MALDSHFEVEARAAAKRKEFIETGVQLGQLSGSVAGEQDRGAKAARERSDTVQDAEERRAKQSADDILFIQLLDQLKQELADTRERRLALEEELIAEFGEDFVVDNANMYLEPEQLERLPGETDAEYRERLEQELADKMLNPDGSVKAEYKHLKIAQWLKEKAQENKLQNEIDRATEKMADMEARAASGEDISAERAKLTQGIRDSELRGGQKATSQLGTEFARSVNGEASTAVGSDQTLDEGIAALGLTPKTV